MPPLRGGWSRSDCPCGSQAGSRGSWTPTGPRAMALPQVGWAPRGTGGCFQEFKTEEPSKDPERFACVSVRGLLASLLGAPPSLPPPSLSPSLLQNPFSEYML